MHVDFIVGRGRRDFQGALNLPIDAVFNSRNCVYIDSWDLLKPDICAKFSEVNFGSYGITPFYDPFSQIQVRIFFDWSTFFCGCIQHLFKKCTELGRRCEIYVPLLPSENSIPSDIKRTLWQPVFTVELVSGKYPLFDWGTEKNIYQYVNTNFYLKIIYRN